MKKNVWSNAEFYLLLGMMAFCAVLAWQISVITVSESRIFPIVILVVSALVFDVIFLALTYVCFGVLLKMATPTGIFY